MNDPYRKTIPRREDGTSDIYDVIFAYKVSNPAVEHAIKKLLCPGVRGAKGVLQDLEEARKSIGRAIELEQGALVAVPESTRKPKTCPVCLKPGCEIQFHRAMELAEVGIPFKELTTETTSDPRVVWLVDRPVVLEKQPVQFNCPPLCSKCHTLHHASEGCRVQALVEHIGPGKPAPSRHSASKIPLPPIAEEVRECPTCGFPGCRLCDPPKEKPT